LPQEPSELQRISLSKAYTLLYNRPTIAALQKARRKGKEKEKEDTVESNKDSPENTNSKREEEDSNITLFLKDKVKARDLTIIINNRSQHTDFDKEDISESSQHTDSNKKDSESEVDKEDKATSHTKKKSQQYHHLHPAAKSGSI